MRLLNELRGALYVDPDQRLGQLLMNIAGQADIWNVTDEEWIDLLHKHARSVVFRARGGDRIVEEEPTE